MSLPMQEPTQESEDPVNQENPAEESSEQAPQEANEAAEKPTEEEEIDHGKLSNSKLPSGRTKLSAPPLSWTIFASACLARS